MLAVHGAFDGASAWALRIAMEDYPAREFLVDLSHAEEACDFAAGLLSCWSRQWARVKRVRFRPGTPEHERLLARHGLEVAAGDALGPQRLVSPASPVAAPA